MKAKLLVTCVIILPIQIQSTFDVPAGCVWKEAKYELLCSIPTDKFAAIPSVSEELSIFVEHLVIENQSNLRLLKKESFSSVSMPNLKTLLIRNCSLEKVEPEAFCNLQHLVEVQFENNKEYKELQWQSFVTDSAKFVALDFKKNPAVNCDCSVYWITFLQSLQDSKTDILIPMTNLSLEVSVIDLLHLPKSVIPPDRCSDKKVSFLEYFSKTEVSEKCQRMIPHLELSVQALVQSSEPDNLWFQVNDSVRITCSAKPAPGELAKIDLMLVFIEHDGEHNWYRIPIEKQQKLSGANQVTITFHNLSVQNNSWIGCIPAHESNVVLPMIAVKPLFIAGKPEVIGEIEHSEDLYHKSCTAHVKSFPPPILKWVRLTEVGEKLVINNDYTEIYDTEYAAEWFHEQISTLEVQKINHLQDMYDAEACNRYGCIRAPCNLSWESKWGTRINVNLKKGKSQLKKEKSQLVTKLPRRSSVWNKPFMVIFPILISVTFIVFFVIWKKFCFKKCMQRFRLQQRESTSREMQPLQLRNIEDNINYSGTVYSEMFQFSPTVKQIEFSQITIINELGQGAFGLVYLAEYHNIKFSNNREVKACENSNKLIAAKTLKTVSADQINCLQKEAEYLSQLEHPNIVTFCGISIDDEKGAIFLLFEFMKLGNLRQFVQDRSPDAKWLNATGNADVSILETPDLLDICLQVARGLAYLTQNHFIHRDLAARNCLVSDGPTIKISDFGMSKDVYCAEYYKVEGRRMLPVRWMAPEGYLYGKFFLGSDIWSWAVVAWECFAYGKQPWFGFSNHEVIEKVQNLEILDIPDTCPEQLSALMLECWAFDVESRPSANSLVYRMEKMSNDFKSSGSS